VFDHHSLPFYYSSPLHSTTLPFDHHLPVKWISQLHLSLLPIRLLFTTQHQLTFVLVAMEGQQPINHCLSHQPCLFYEHQKARLFWSVVSKDRHFLMLRSILQTSEWAHRIVIPSLPLHMCLIMISTTMKRSWIATPPSRMRCLVVKLNTRRRPVRYGRSTYCSYAQYQLANFPDLHKRRKSWRDTNRRSRCLLLCTSSRDIIAIARPNRTGKL
jgi:hypothetical protein